MKWLLIGGVVIIALIIIYFMFYKDVSVNMFNKSNPTIAKICASIQWDGYVVDEYRNDKGEIGGYTLRAGELTPGASTYYYDAEGKLVGEVWALPYESQSDAGKAALNWSRTHFKQFPITSTYQCD